MYECGKLKKVIGNKILFLVIFEQCGLGALLLCMCLLGPCPLQKQSTIHTMQKRKHADKFTTEAF